MLAKLLTKIILADDAKHIEDLVDSSTKYMELNLPVVKVIRLKKRIGLIRARIVGAKAANSNVIVFFGSHCEAYHNWLPSMLGVCNYC